jgi:ubiquinone/menaquinone biosynthesis C-methylase UbiE
MLDVQCQRSFARSPLFEYACKAEGDGMTEKSTEEAREFYAQTYDATIDDWPGEMDFYKRLAGEAQARGQGVLELACGTGRVAIRLANEGVRVVGLDVSRSMVEVAREKSKGMSNTRWVVGDMRSFVLGEQFGLIIIPGHAFQNLVEPQDQIDCLEASRKHLAHGGKLVIHVDHAELDWLGDLHKRGGSGLEDAGEFIHPINGRRVLVKQSWDYEPSTQTAIHRTVWEELAPDGAVVKRLDTGEVKIHCVFRYEMEHALRRAGFGTLEVLGGFDGAGLTDASSEMIWIAEPS